MIGLFRIVEQNISLDCLITVLDYINRRKWLQEAELQPKVRMMIYQAKRNQGLRPSTSETPLSVDEEEKDTIVHHLSKPRGQCEVRWRSERVAVAPVFTSNFHKKPLTTPNWDLYFTR